MRLVGAFGLIEDFYSTLISYFLEDTVLRCIGDIDFMVIRDSLQILQRLTKAVNEQLGALSSSERVDYIAKHSKLIKRFLKVHRNLAGSSNIFFKVMHFDQSTVGGGANWQNLAEFVANLFEFLLLVSRGVLSFFPRIKCILVKCLSRFISELSAYILGGKESGFNRRTIRSASPETDFAHIQGDRLQRAAGHFAQKPNEVGLGRRREPA